MYTRYRLLAGRRPVVSSHSHPRASTDFCFSCYQWQLVAVIFSELTHQGCHSRCGTLLVCILSRRGGDTRQCGRSDWAVDEASLAICIVIVVIVLAAPIVAVAIFSVSTGVSPKDVKPGLAGWALSGRFLQWGLEEQSTAWALAASFCYN